MVSVGSIGFDTYASLDGVFNDLKKLQNHTFQVKIEAIAPKVDLKELHQLNKTLDQKEKHLKKVVGVYRGNPIVPRVDLRPLHKLNRELDSLASKKVSVKVDVDYATSQAKQVNQKIHHSVEVSNKDSSDRITKEISQQSKQIVKAVLSTKKGAIGKTLDIGGAIGTSFLTGFLTNATKGVGTRFEAGLNRSLEDVIGSVDLFADKLGQQLGKQSIKAGEILIDAIKKGISSSPQQRIKDMMLEIKQNEARERVKARREAIRTGQPEKEVKSVNLQDKSVQEAIGRKVFEEIQKERKELNKFINKIFGGIAPTRQEIQTERLTKKGARSRDLTRQENLIQEGRGQFVKDAKRVEAESLAEIKKRGRIIRELRPEVEKVQSDLKALLQKQNALNLSKGASESLFQEAVDTGARDPFVDYEAESQNIKRVNRELKELGDQIEQVGRKLQKGERMLEKQAELGNKAGRALERAQKEQLQMFRQGSADAFRQEFLSGILKDLGAGSVNIANLPQVREGTGRLTGHTEGTFDVLTNTIFLRKDLYLAFKRREEENQKLVGVLAHELGHKFQLGSGFDAAVKSFDISLGRDRNFNRVAPEISNQELLSPGGFGEVPASVLQMMKGYQKSLRAIEADAEVGSRRLVAKRFSPQEQTQQTEGSKEVLGSLKKTGEAALTVSKFVAGATLDIAKFGFGVSKATEELVFNFIPGAKQMKKITQVGVPLLGAGMAASTIPGLLPALGGAMDVAATGSQSLLSPAIDAIASGVGEAVAGSLPGFASGAAGTAAETLALGAGNAIAGALPAVTALGVAAKTTSSIIDVTGEKINELTGSNTKAIAAGENLTKSLFRLGGQVKDFTDVLAEQRSKAQRLRQQLPSSKELKALPPQQRIESASTMARIAAQGIVDQKALMTAIPKGQRMGGGEIAQARALLGEFTKQFKKAKRILAKDKIDIDDVVNMKNITSQVEIVGSDINDAIARGSKSNKAHKKAMKQVGEELLDTIDVTIERKSPPRKFITRGLEIPQAIAIGIARNIKLASYKIKDLGVNILREADFAFKGLKSKAVEKTKGLKDLGQEIEFRFSPKFKEGDFKQEIEAIEKEQKGTLPVRFDPGIVGDKKLDDLIDRSRKDANRFDSIADRIMSAEDEAATVGRAKRIQKAFKKIWSSEELGYIKQVVGRRGKLILGLIKDLGVKGALRFGALGVAGFLAFKGITSAVRATGRAIADLFLNTQKNIEAFSRLYSLNLKFKAAGLGSGAGFAIAQEQGISTQAVANQAVITSSLRRRLGTEVAADIAKGLSKGLTGLGLQGEDLSGGLRAFSQIGSKGRLQAEEKLQLAERGIDINTISESALGLSASQLEDMQRSGQILAVEYLPAIAEELALIGTNAELPTAELQRAKNNAEAFRAELGKGVLDTTRPWLRAFNAVAEQGTLVKGSIQGVAIVFTGLAITGTASLIKLATSIPIVNSGLAAMGGFIKANALAMVGFTAQIAALTAGVALIGVTIAALNKRSTARLGLEEQLEKSRAIAKSFKDIEVSTEKIGRFQGDIGSQVVNTLSLGGLGRRQVNQERVAVANAIAESNKIFAASVRSPEQLQKTVDSIRVMQSQLAAKKVELIDLTNAKASREEVQKVNREIGDLSGIIRGNKKEITSFINEYENIKGITEASFFPTLDPESQSAYQQLLQDYERFIPLFTRLRDEMAQKMRFELEFNLSQNSIEAAKMDLDFNLAQLDLDIISNARSGNVNAALESDSQRRDFLDQSLAKTEAAIARQRNELKEIPVELAAQIEAIAGGDLLNLSSESLLQALTKLESSSENVGEDLKAALDKAKQLKQNELETLAKRKELLELELRITAQASSRALARNNITATTPLRSIRREAVDAKLAIAQEQVATRLSSSAVSIANTRIEMNKSAGELAVTRDRISQINKSLNSFDEITKGKVKDIIGKPTESFSQALRELSSEQLQQARQGFGQELSIDPVLEEAFRQLESGVQLSEQSDQLRLAASQGQAQVAESLRNAYKTYADFMRSLSDQIADAQAQITRLSTQNQFALAQNQVRSATVGSTGTARRFGDLFSGLLSSIEAIANDELSLADEQRANARSLRDLRIRYAEVVREIQPLSSGFNELAIATEKLTDKFGESADSLYKGSMNLPVMTPVSSPNSKNNTTSDTEAYSKKQDIHLKDPRIEKLEVAQSSLSQLREERSQLNLSHQSKMPDWISEIDLGGIKYDRFNGMQSQNDRYMQTEKKLIDEIVNLQKDIKENPLSQKQSSDRNHDKDSKNYKSYGGQNIQGNFSTPIATNSTIDGLESLKQQIVSIKTEASEIKFDRAIIDFKDKVVLALQEMDERAVTLSQQATDTSRNIRNLGERFGAIKTDPVSKAIREVNEAYDQQLRTVNSQERAFRKEFNLGGLSLTGDVEKDRRAIASRLTPDFDNNQLIAEALERVKGNAQAKSQVLDLVSQLRSGILGQDEFLLEMLQRFEGNRTQLEGDRSSAVNIQETRATERLSNRRADFEDSLRRMEIENINSQRFGTGIPALFSDNKTRELALETEMLNIAKQRRDLIAQINSLAAEGVIKSEEERQGRIAQVEAIASEQEQLARLRTNPWLEQAKEGVVVLKSEMMGFLEGSRSLWEALGITALTVLSNVAKEFALTALSSSGGEGKGGGGLFGQIFGAFVGSLSEGYNGNMYVPNYANGKYGNAIALGMGIQEAMKRENHSQAFPAVINRDEVVLSAQGGGNSDAAAYKRMRMSGEWERFKQGYQNEMNYMQIPSYQGGTPSPSSLSTIANNQSDNSTRIYNNTYNYPQPTSYSDRSGRESVEQRVRRERRERQRTRENEGN